MKYDIIEAGDKTELSALITKNLKVGWILCGGPMVNDGMFYQAITHRGGGAPSPQTMGEDSLMTIAGYEGCKICGEMNCGSELHSKLGEVVDLIDGLKKIK